ncbi:MAG: protein kinase [Kofleriaceae bacterium]|nr:protein kinase [Kofleriaceae bacterium]
MKSVAGEDEQQRASAQQRTAEPSRAPSAVTSGADSSPAPDHSAPAADHRSPAAHEANDRTITTGADDDSISDVGSGSPPADAHATPHTPRSVPSPDDPTRTSTGRPDDQGSEPAPRADDRLPAPLQFRDPDRYQILGEHGRGGLGRVFRARDKELGRDVAVKELLHRGNTSELRFFREALITARLEHPGIVPVHEAGRWPDGTPFYAMKLVQGRPLKALIDECKTLEERLALLPHIIAVADAIAYAHDRKIIHRDLKPSNVIVGDFGETVVIDWGLAKDLTASEPDPAGDGPYRTAARADGLTVTGSVLGTPAYMAPEQARGERVDERADVYAIGTILRELCNAPAPDESARSKAPPDIAPDLAAICEKATWTDQSNRYASARPLAEDLRAFASGTRLASRRYSPKELALRWLRRHRPLVIAISMALALAVSLGTAALLEIVAQRDRATQALASAEHATAAESAARRAAEDDRDRARLAQAELLLATDPTRAKALLSTDPHHPKSPREALLAAEVVGHPIADRTITFPFAIDQILRSEDRKQLAVVTGDRRAHLIDLETGVQSELATRVLTPTFHVVRHDGSWFLLEASAHGPQLSSSDGSRSISLAELPVLPSVAVSRPEGLLLLDHLGRLWAASDSSPPVLRADGIQTAAPLGAQGLLVCSHNELSEAASRTPVPGSCGMLSTNGDYFATTNRVGELVVGTLGHSRTVRVEGKVLALEVADSGLVAIADQVGRGWYLPNGARALVPGPNWTAGISAVAADGNLVAWGHSDGTTIIMNVETGAVWPLSGHAGGIWKILVDSRNSSVATVSPTDIRLWRLSAPPLQSSTKLPCRPLSPTVSRDGNIAVACDNGFALTIVNGHAEPAHRHANTSFGVAWLHDQVCTGGWDGQVLCSSRGSAAPTVVSRQRRPIRWLAAPEDQSYIVFLTSDGEVFQYGGVRPAELILSLPAEAHRVAVTSDGRYVAAGDDIGTLAVYDQRTKRAVTIKAHRDAIDSLSWSEHMLATTGWDGTLRRWSPALELVETVESKGPLRQVVQSRDCIAFSQAGNNLVIRKAGSDTTLELKSKIEDLKMSPNGRFAAAFLQDEIVIVDIDKERLATIHQPTASVPCGTFLNESTLLACGASQTLLTYSLSNISFTDANFHTRGTP